MLIKHLVGSHTLHAAHTAPCTLVCTYAPVILLRVATGSYASARLTSSHALNPPWLIHPPAHTPTLARLIRPPLYHTHWPIRPPSAPPGSCPPFKPHALARTSTVIYLFIYLFNATRSGSYDLSHSPTFAWLTRPPLYHTHWLVRPCCLAALTHHHLTAHSSTPRRHRVLTVSMSYPNQPSMAYWKKSSYGKTLLKATPGPPTRGTLARKPDRHGRIPLPKRASRKRIRSLMRAYV